MAGGKQGGSLRRRRAALPVLPLLLGWFAASAVSGAAAEPVSRLERLEVSLWPEFDRPAMLVMLGAWLPEGVDYPATVLLPMPEEAGAPSAVAYRAPDGNLLLAAHRVLSEAGATRVEITTLSPEVRLEYYAPLETATPARAYRFHWPAGTAVARAGYDVLHPWGAVDVTVSPAGTRSRIRDGMIEERGDLGAIGEDEELFVEVRYFKPAAGGAAGTSTPASAKTPPAAAPAGPLLDGEAHRDDPRWLLLFVVSTAAFLCGYAAGRLRRARR